MIALELPPGDAPTLQQALWEQDRIEIPVIAWQQRRFVRPSCHLYNCQADLERLVAALKRLL